MHGPPKPFRAKADTVRMDVCTARAVLNGNDVRKGNALWRTDLDYGYGCPRITGQQCIYDENGRLVTHGLAAGTPDLAHGGGLSHALHDVLPFFMLAGSLDSALNRGTFFRDLYMKVRPPNNGNLCPENP